MNAVATPGQPERAEGYEPFFGFNEAPFSLAPDPRFLFASASHSAALAQVSSALERREPLVVITGEIGTGKTLLCRTLLQQLRRKTFLSVINDPLLERDDLLKALLQDFGVISKDRTRLTAPSRHELIEALHAFLRSLAPIQAHAVVIIDEAQHLQPDLLEQIRLLSNIDDERGTLLQIVLVGQPDLEPLLARPELRQLQQRVSRRFVLEPLNRAEVPQYITHRLAVAREAKPTHQDRGATELAQQLADWAGSNAGVEFAPDAIQLIAERSAGVPRVINLLCDRSLEEAYASRLRVIDRPLIHAAARALGVGETGTPATPNATVPRTEFGPDASFWAGRPDSAKASQSEKADPIVPRADEGAAVGLRSRPAAAPRLARYLVVAIALASLAAVAILYFVRPSRPPVAQAPPPAAAPAPSAPRASGAQPDPAPAGAAAPVPNSAPTAGTPAPKAIAPPPSMPAAASTGGSFEIVVASFRTDGRAASVAAEVEALGLPIRRRNLDGWRQLLAGPFASRADAEAAQRRLQRAGLTGTQIVETAR
jgi:general secretion pathway protein A